MNSSFKTIGDTMMLMILYEPYSHAGI